MEADMFNPTKIIAIGLNYMDHAKEMNHQIPTYPLIFMKPSTAVILNDDYIIYPPDTKELHYEGELAVVIKNKTKNISKEDARYYIAGYTCANDVTARDLQRLDGQWIRSKSFDTFCPLGPRIISNIDPTHLSITTRVNGSVRQKSNTDNMIFDVYELVSYISRIMTLLPGDVIITGTPPGVGSMNVGDIVEVEIEGIGILKNKVTSC
ncbi:MAG: fumarylacetoacetate hydrolase family protein [Pseudomonadota bacterium]|nr:fumarylacetoacetate hydrolase family protein [Pseudomonadota bacterium]